MCSVRQEADLIEETEGLGVEVNVLVETEGVDLESCSVEECPLEVCQEPTLQRLS